MKTIAVITEFNPLHNGHYYFLSAIRAESEADCVIAVMSGDFVQRGEPAVFDKYVRTKAALRCGADLVLELPVRFSSANAGDFALGAVSMIDMLGCVDELWFGSESGDIAPFIELAGLLYEEQDLFKESLQAGLRSGLSYPEARAGAIAVLYGSMSAENGSSGISLPEMNGLLASPNSILGLEYCIALKKLGSGIVPKTIKRTGSGHDAPLSYGSCPSASAVRELIFSNGTDALSGFVPDHVTGLYKEYCKNSSPIRADDFSLLLKYKLMSCSTKELCMFDGVSKDLAERILNNLNAFRSFSQFADLIKTRNITRTHANRALLHILLEIYDKGTFHLSYFTPPSCRILGMGSCKELLGIIKKNGKTALCSRSSEIKESYSKEDLFASNLYESVKAEKSSSPFIHEFNRKLIRVQPSLLHK